MKTIALSIALTIATIIAFAWCDAREFCASNPTHPECVQNAK